MIPDPFVIAIVLTIVTIVAALAVGTFPALTPEHSHLGALIDVWGSDGSGFGYLLKFGMQMALILVTGYALASTPLIQRVINGLAALPRSGASAVAMVALAACVAGLINWGLGLIFGALLARDVGRSMEARGIAVHYPLLAAAGYMGLLVWHGGLSGSAPLTMTTAAGAAAALPASVTAVTPTIPLSQTIFSPMNLVLTGGLLIIIPLVAALLTPRTPRTPEAVRPFALPVTIWAHHRHLISERPRPLEIPDLPGGSTTPQPSTSPSWRSSSQSLLGMSLPTGLTGQGSMK